MKIVRPRRCLRCGKYIETRLAFGGSSGRKYCSLKCKKAAARARWVQQGGQRDFYPNLSRVTVGAINELRVATDLLRKGYEVFRALTPNSPCDLAILKKSKLLRIEVRTGYIVPGGRVVTSRKHHADVLAIALPGSIKYEGKKLP